MSSRIVIGSGVLGLSVAEYLSRKSENVTVISNENPLAGSLAAAANLATKGQLYGRDKHFQMKLDGKAKYQIWIENLLKELNEQKAQEDFFRQGIGVDSFASKEERDRHLKRVIQPERELKKRNLPTDSILASEENKIIYYDEAWIDRAVLLSLLRRVCEKRGVKFVQKEFSDEDAKVSSEEDCLIFCTGAWTKSLLESLSFPIPNGLFEKERMTFGSTFFLEKNERENDIVLDEFVSSELKSKVTLSGSDKIKYISSSTVKVNSFSDATNQEKISNLNENNEILFDILEKNKIFVEKDKLTRRDGFRIGYGHSELVLEKIKKGKFNFIVCAGAHKSGFLFAPVVGEKIFEMLCQEKKSDT